MLTVSRIAIHVLALGCMLACAARAQADPAPGEALIELATAKQQLPRAQLVQELRRHLQRLAAELHVRPPDLTNVTEDRLVVIRGDYDGSRDAWQNRVVLVEGALELAVAMNCIIIVGGDLDLSSNDANFIVSGGSADVASNGAVGFKAANAVVARLSLDISHAGAITAYAEQAIDLSHPRGARILSPNARALDPEVEGASQELVPSVFGQRGAPARAAPDAGSASAASPADRRVSPLADQAVRAPAVSDAAALRVSDSQLHAISVNEGTLSRVRVNVSVTGTPVTLLLTAQNRVRWELDLARGVDLRRVLVLGSKPQTVLGAPPGTEILAIDRDAATPIGNLGKTRDMYLDVMSKIESMTGQRPRTFQTAYRADVLTIDGRRHREAPEIASEFAGSGATRLLTRFPDDGLIADKWTFVASAKTAGMVVAKASRAHTKGKVYAEARLRVRKQALEPGTYTNVGLTQAHWDTQYMDFTASEVEHKPVYAAIPFGQQKLFHDGDIIGIAADLDAARLYFRVNGEWVTGAPGSGGIPLRPERAYTIGVRVNWGGPAVPEGLREAMDHAQRNGQVPPEQLRTWLEYHDSWQLNLGATRFAYPPPPGFVAYDG